MLCFRFAPWTLAAALAAVSVAPLQAQRWEFGAGGGASFYNSQSASGSRGSADAKFKPGYGFSAYLGQIGDRLGGELRYTWLSNEMELSGNGKTFTMGGRSQALHYDLNFYFNKRNAKTRPYVFAGGGVKQYTGTGPDVALQPLLSIAVLTRTSEWKPLISAGGGVRFTLSKHAQARAEVRAYMTQAPTKVITPVSPATLGGWYLDIVPMFSLSYTW